MNDKKYIIKLIKEEFDKLELPILCDLDIKKMGSHMLENGFGKIKTHSGFNLKLSKSLCLNNEVIGGYMLRKLSMIQSIKYAIHWHKEGVYKNLKFFVDNDFLNKYKGKKGIFSDYIYIEDEFTGNNYANILIDYSKSIGDYVWGGSIPGKSWEYWFNKHNRIKIFEFVNKNGIECVFSVTPI